MQIPIRAVVAIITALPALAFGQIEASAAFPTGAMILEIRELSPSVRANRALVLWMEHAEKHPRFDGRFGYACPEETRGSFYSGPTRVSLLDTVTNKIINTVIVRGEDKRVDQFDVPYMIHPKYYRVDPPLKSGEGKPVVIDLKDYNDDGKALEFAFFNAADCNLVMIQLVGYSTAHDRVVQYPVHLMNWAEQGKVRTSLWLDRVFLQKPVRPGQWEYTVPERFCPIPTYKVRYDPAKESFSGTITWKQCDP